MATRFLSKGDDQQNCKFYYFRAFSHTSPFIFVGPISILFVDHPTRHYQCDQVEVLEWADNISAISAQRRQGLDLHRRLLRTIFLHSAHSSSDGQYFMVNQS